MPLHIIVGAGVAGLQTARALLRAGLHVLVLERKEDIGGVWQRDLPYSSLQVPADFYAFPEFPWPSNIEKDDYPTGRQVRTYIQAYAKHFGLYEHIKFRCQLAQLQRTRTGGWDVLYLDHSCGTFHKCPARYVIICTGINALPHRPKYKGSELFCGVQLHAQEFRQCEVARGKRVVIVGAGKTALDCVAEVSSSKVAESVTWLFRQAHWPMPRVISGAVPMQHVLFSKLPHRLLPPYYTASPLRRLAHRMAQPLKQLGWAALERSIKRDFDLTGVLRPHVSLAQDLFFGGQILDGSWNSIVSSGAVAPLLGEIDRFTRTSVVLTNGTEVEADLVLYCTGFAKSYDFLEGSIKARLGLQKDGLYLYRNLLPPLVQGLAFIGSEVSTFNSVLTSGLQAEWLARVLTGRVALPTVTAQQEDIRQQQRWRRANMPPQRSRGSVYLLYQAQYHKQLMRDMGFRPHSNALAAVLPCMRPLSAIQYAEAFGGDDETPSTNTSLDAIVVNIGKPLHGCYSLSQLDLPVLDSGSHAPPFSLVAASANDQCGYFDVPKTSLTAGQLFVRATTPLPLSPNASQRQQKQLQPPTPEVQCPQLVRTSSSGHALLPPPVLVSGALQAMQRSPSTSPASPPASGSSKPKGSGWGSVLYTRGGAMAFAGGGSSRRHEAAESADSGDSGATSKGSPAAGRDPLEPVRQLVSALMQQAEHDAALQHRRRRQEQQRRDIQAWQATLAANALASGAQLSGSVASGLAAVSGTLNASPTAALAAAAAATAAAADRAAQQKEREQKEREQRDQQRGASLQRPGDETLALSGPGVAQQQQQATGRSALAMATHVLLVGRQVIQQRRKHFVLVSHQEHGSGHAVPSPELCHSSCGPAPLALQRPFQQQHMQPEASRMQHEPPTPRAQQTAPLRT